MTVTVKKIIKYINDNAAGLTLLFSGFIGISTFLVNFFLFCYTKGRLDYWGIDSSVIEVFNRNFIFEIIFATALFAFYIIISLLFSIPFYCKFKDGKAHLGKRIGSLIFIYVITVVLYGLLLFFSPNPKIILVLPSSNLLFTISIFLIRRVTSKKPSPNKQRTSAISWYVICTFLLLLFIATSFYFLGKQQSQQQVSFSILNNDKVVLYETSSNYFTANCTVQDNNIIIFSAQQGIYDRQNSDIEIHSFASVITNR